MTLFWQGVLLAALMVQTQGAPETVGKLYDLARSQAYEGKLEEAAKTYARVIELNSSFPRAHYGLAQVFWRQGKPDEALKAVSSAIDLSRPAEPDSHEFRIFRARILFSMSRLEEAAAELEGVLALEPGIAVARHLLGRVYMQQGRYDDASEEGMALVRSGERVADGYYLIGKALFKKESYEGAERTLRKAIALRPGHPASHYTLSQVLMRLGRREEARKEIEIHEALQKIEEEIDKLTRGGFEGTTTETWQRLSELYGMLGDFVNARHFAERVLAKTPGDPKALTVLGYVLSKQGDHPAAIETLRKAIKAGPDYALAYNNLAWILATVEGSKDPDEAVRLAEKAIELGSTRKGTLAEAYFSRGEVEKACRILEAAIEEGHPEASGYREQIKRYRESDAARPPRPPAGEE